MIKKNSTTILAIAILSLSSCKRDKYCEIDLTHEPAKGLISGEEFIVETAVASLIDATDQFMIELYSFRPSTDQCGFLSIDYPEETKKHAVIIVDKKVGTYNVNQEEGIAEVSASLLHRQEGQSQTMGITGNCGKVEITQITEDNISGKVHIDLEDGQNFLKGSFSASICD